MLNSYKIEAKEERKKTKTIKVNNKRWDIYKREIKNNINQYENKDKISYQQMEKSIKDASKMIIKKRKITEKLKIPLLGYNKMIKKAIKERRMACSEWKKEINNNLKKIKYETYIPEEKGRNKKTHRDK